MITGTEYLLRGRVVTVTRQWNGKSNPDLPRLRERLPLVRTGRTAPRTVMVQFPDGTRQVRPFRGLRALPKPQAPSWTQPELDPGACAHEPTPGPDERPVCTVAVAGGLL